jgi:hypothetical protein
MVRLTFFGSPWGGHRSALGSFSVERLLTSSPTREISLWHTFLPVSAFDRRPFNRFGSKGLGDFEEIKEIPEEQLGNFPGRLRKPLIAVNE